MPRFRAAALLLGAAAAGCSPTFNWRELTAEPSPLRVLLPCKPESTMRRVPMAGASVDMHGVGCETGGATFAVLHADLRDPGRSAEALAQWNQATLSHLKAGRSHASAFRPPGALDLPSSQRVRAAGQQADGSAVEGEAAYFAHGTRVYQAVVYARRLPPEAVGPFFDGLKFP